MKKFKFLFLAALVAVMFIGCAQPTDDDTPIIPDAQPTDDDTPIIPDAQPTDDDTPIIPDAQPTVVKVTTAYRGFNGSVGFFKTASVTYSDNHVDKYEIITTPANVTKVDGSWYYVYSATLLNAPSQIDFFNGTPLIVVDKDKEPNIETEFKFSEIYTKVE